MSRRLGKLFLVFVISFNSAASAQSGVQDSKVLKTLENIDRFIQSRYEDGSVYFLNRDAVEDLALSGTPTSLLTAARERIQSLRKGPTDPLARLDWAEKKTEVQLEARHLTMQIFELPYEEINLALLSLLHRYLFDDHSRLAVKMILEEVADYRFSDAEIHRLKKEASWQTQFSRGSLFTVLVALGASLIGGRKVFSAKTWITLKEAAKRSLKQTTVSQSTVKGKGTELDELIAMIEKDNELFNLGSKTAAVATSGSKVSTSDMIGRIGKMKLLREIGTSFFSPAGPKGFLLITSAATAGGMANVGLYKLTQELFPDDFSNSVIDFKTIRDDYYDGLAALRLSCLSHDLVKKSGQYAGGSLFPLYQSINQIHADLEILKMINPRYVDVTQLPEQIRADFQTGQIFFGRATKGKVVEESFECDKFKGRTENPLTVSLNEVVRDLTRSIELISERLARPDAKEPL